MDKIPRRFDSWLIVSNRVSIKEIDKSALIHHGTGIPKDIRWFFDIEDMLPGEKRDVKLVYNNKIYEAHFDKQPHNSLRTRILWKKDLEEEINQQFVKVAELVINKQDIEVGYEPLMEFIKIESTRYEIILRYRGH